MKKTFVVVADEYRARFLRNRDGKKFLVEEEDLVNPEARAHERDLIADKPGRSFDRVGGGRHSMEQETDAKKQDAEAFAREITQKIEKERNERKFERLVLVAAPAFLGMLRDKLTDECEKLVWKSFDKDLTKAGISQIEDEVFTLR